MKEISDLHDQAFNEELNKVERLDMETEMKEIERMYQEEMKIRDAYESKRLKKENLKKSGGIKSESPIWDEDE